MSLAKDFENSADNVADHVAKGLPAIAQQIAEDLGVEEVTITIPEIKITIGFGRKQQ